jgi:ParB family chromosome partitioning protein
MAKKIERKPSIAVGKKDLGAGIKAMFKEKTLEAALNEDFEKVVKELANNTASIPIVQVEPNPAQPRSEFDEVALEELAASLKTHGLIQPITVRRLSEEEFQIISGERRWRAAQKAGFTEIPAYVRIANDTEMLEMALIENIQRHDLNPIEIAETYARLKHELGLTDEQLSARMGKIDRSTVTNYLRLLNFLTPEIQAALKERRISFGHGKVLAGINDFSVQDALFKMVLKEGLSVRALEKERDIFMPKPKEGKAPKKSDLPDDYNQIQQQFRTFFGTKQVNLKLKESGKGQIILSFSSVKELNDLLDCIDED